MENSLPSIPVKRYFTIGEVGDLCGVKPHVLRYWEQEFSQLRPMKRRGNRRYYQHHEVLMIRRIRELLYDQGFTISGARNKMLESVPDGRDHGHSGLIALNGSECFALDASATPAQAPVPGFNPDVGTHPEHEMAQIRVLPIGQVRQALYEIRALLG